MLKNNKLELLSAISNGLSQGMEDISHAYLTEQEQKKILLDSLLQKSDEAKELEAVSKLGNNSVFDNFKNNGLLFLNSMGLKTASPDLTEQKVLIAQIVSKYIKKHKLPNDKATRKKVTQFLATRSDQELAKEFENEVYGSTAAIKKSAQAVSANDDTIVAPLSTKNNTTAVKGNQDLTNLYSSLDSIDDTDRWWMDHGSDWLKEHVAEIAKNFSRYGRFGTRLTDYLAKKLKKPINTDKAEQFFNKYDAGVDKILGAKGNLSNIEKNINNLIDPLLFIGPIKALKTLGLGGRIAKNIGLGALYGGLGAQDSDDIGQSLATGAITGGILGSAGEYMSNKLSKKNIFNKIAADATIKDLKTAQERAAILGPKATIPEIVGSEIGINEAKRRGGRSVKHYDKMGSKVKNEALNIAESLPISEEYQIYNKLAKAEAAAKEKAIKMYEVGPLNNGLNKKELLDFYRAAQEATAEINGLPKLKPQTGNFSDSYNQKLKSLVAEGHHFNTTQQYNDWYLKNIKDLPTPDDFMRYRRIIKKKLDSDPGNNTLINLLDNLNKIADSGANSSTLKAADRYYAKNVAPYQAKDVKDAIRSSQWGEKGPSISKIFSGDSPETRKLFDLLTTDDKKEVLGTWLQEITAREELHPARALEKFWKALPSHIKNSNDQEIQKLLKQIQNVAKIGKTLSSVQQTTTASIGSRMALDKIKKGIPLIGGVAGAALAAENSDNLDLPTALILALGLYKGSKALNNKRLNRAISQKNLSNYFNRANLKEGRLLRQLGVRTPILTASNSEEAKSMTK